MERAEIHIKNGIYREKIVVPANKKVALIGESREDTVISHADYARQIGPDGKEIGTFGTSTLSLYGNDQYVENLTVENTAGYGPNIGQALALSAGGDRVVFRGVNILGNQDTLYMSGDGRQYYKDCYIEGHDDFIFGSATAVFDRCHIHSLREGYITAASTEADRPFGFVFFHCTLTGENDHSVFLGRPWRPYASVTFLYTKMGDHIKPEGWDNWRNPANEQTARYAEYKSTGPGANPDRRVRWAEELTPEEAEQITIDRIFSRKDRWNPSA